MTTPMNLVNIQIADCVAAIGDLPERSIDVVVTSPPYNIGIEYGTYKDDKSRVEYLHWLGRVFVAIRRALRDEGSFFLNVGNIPKDQWIVHDIMTRFRPYFELQNTIHWVKAISIDHEGLSVGHYKPINSPRFVNDAHEFVFHLTKTGHVAVRREAIGVPYVDKSNVGRWKAGKDKGDLRCRGNCWFVPYETIQSRESDRPHPATFPVKLAEMCLKLHGVDRYSVVLDPFAGLGSTLIAAKKIGVAHILGYDIDKQYVELARERVEAA